MTQRKTVGALLVSGALVLLLAAAALQALAPAPAPGGGLTWIGDALWRDRGFDVVVQGFIILAGALAVIFLLRQETEARSGG
jgi:multisubunit Na+/H+ antiporter MnhB subunit